MPKASDDRVAALMKDIETHAKKLRSDIRKKVAATGLPKRLQAGAKKLRKQVAAAAKQLDEHARRVAQGHPGRHPKEAGQEIEAEARGREIACIQVARGRISARQFYAAAWRVRSS